MASGTIELLFSAVEQTTMWLSNYYCSERRTIVLTYEQALTRIAQLEAKVKRISLSSWFDCLTREALLCELEERSIELSTGHSAVYFDVDNLKAANNKYGKAGSSIKIRDSIRGHDLLGQVFSGDEMVLVLPSAQAYGAALRIQAELKLRGLSATFVIDRYQGSITLDWLEDNVCSVKRICKGCIIDLRDSI